MTPSEVARNYLESFAAGDPTSIAGWVTDDFVNEHTAALGSGCEGRAEYERRLPAFLSSMPGLRYEVEQIIAEQHRVVVCYELRAAANGRPIALRGAMVFEIRDEKIARRTDYWDSLMFQRQAGLA